jgi:CRISPR-associated endonuclease Csy4
MDSYLDLTLRPDPEFPESQLMNALYAKLHRALVSAKANTIAVCFPALAGLKLGGVLRLVGPSAALTDLMAGSWLHGMTDHLLISELRALPALLKHRKWQRIQCKSSPERLRRRQMKRHNLSEAQARERVPDAVAETLKAPFLQMASASTGQRFRLFLKAGPLQAQPETGSFNAYGLSQSATVPWF